MNRIALLIPARNATGHLGRLLASAAAQTRPFDEIWVFDDASDDGTLALAHAHGARAMRVEVPVGPSEGKNRLAAATSCEWVHFHDADEALEPEFVSRARQWMAGDDADVVLFATEDREDAGGRILGRSVWNDAALVEDPVAYTIRRTITNCGLYRRAAFLAAGGFDLDEAVRYNEDQAMHIRLALAGLRFRADSYLGVIVYRRVGSMSAAHPIECARAQVEVLQRTVARTGRRYAGPVTERAWQAAGVCAGYSDWTYVRKSLSLMRLVGGRVPAEQWWLLRFVARFAPALAVYGREVVVRLLKPELRRGMAQVPSPSLRSGARRAVRS